MRTNDMLLTHPKHPSLGNMGVSELASSIEACLDCSSTCSICADACLSEPAIESLLRCIRLNLDCADICQATARMLSRVTGVDPGVFKAQLKSCITACRLCAEECEKHAGRHDHCRVCAEACRRCERECLFLLDRLPATAAVEQ